MRKFLDRLYIFSATMAAISMSGIVLLVGAQIVARFLNTNIPSSDDISGYMVAWSTFMGLAYAMKKGDHIRVDLFINMVPDRFRQILMILVSFLGSILIAIFFYFAFHLVMESYEFGDRTAGHISMPLWIIQLPYLLGIFLLLISIIDVFITELFFHKSK